MEQRSPDIRQSSGVEPSRTRGVSGVKIAVIVVLIACVIGGVAGGLYLANTYSQIKDAQNTQQLTPETPVQGSEEPQANPIDFASLEQQNDEIYAWVYVPGTNVNYPVLQHPDDDSYYLTHNVDGEGSELGAVFSEAKYNSKDFQDPLTVLYAHNGAGETFFSTLHRFQDKAFFDEHESVYVYTPGHVRTYTVVSAYTTDDTHLMTLHNYQTAKGLKQFESSISHPKALDANTRKVKMNKNSKLLVLSTCNEGDPDETGRYVVCGVMADERATR